MRLLPRLCLVMLWPLTAPVVFPANGAIHLHAAESAYRAALAAQLKGNLSEAVRQLEAAIDIEPTYLDAYDKLAGIFAKRGRAAETGRILAMYLQIAPTDVAHRILLGNLLMRDGLHQRALAQFSMALTEQPDDADALAGFVAAAEAAGLKEKAAAAFARGRREHPADTRFQMPSEAPH